MVQQTRFAEGVGSSGQLYSRPVLEGGKLGYQIRGISITEDRAISEGEKPSYRRSCRAVPGLVVRSEGPGANYQLS